MEMDRPPTEAEKAELERRVDKVFKVFKLIQNEWARTNSFQYVCRAKRR